MKQDGSINAQIQRSNSPQTHTSSNTGAVVDCRGYEFAKIVLNTGTFTSSATMNVTVREGATAGGSFSDITGAAFAAVTTANDQTAYVGIVRLDGTERYLRCQATYSGTGKAPMGTTIELIRGQYGEEDTATSFVV